MALFATRCVSTTVPLQDGERDSDLGTGLRQPCSSSAKTKRRRTSDRGELAVVSASTNQFQEASLVERIADAVLYEGYILYPYRPSAVKNQQRWNFGVLCPGSCEFAQGGSENSTMRTECVVEVNSSTTIDVRVRFLQLMLRELAERIADCESSIVACEHVLRHNQKYFVLVPSLQINGTRLQVWQ